MFWEEYMELILYKEITDLVSAAGDAIIKITDGIKHLVKTGASGLEYLSARRDRDRLIRLSARAANLAFVQQASIVMSIDKYLTTKDPSDQDWWIIQDGINTVLWDIASLLEEINTERSDFVIEEAYELLLSSFQTRSSHLESIYKLPPPTKKVERKALKELNKEYKRLLKAFKDAIAQLNIYLKGTEWVLIFYWGSGCQKRINNSNTLICWSTETIIGSIQQPTSEPGPIRIHHCRIEVGSSQTEYTNAPGAGNEDIRLLISRHIREMSKMIVSCIEQPIAYPGAILFHVQGGYFPSVQVGEIDPQSFQDLAEYWADNTGLFDIQ